MTKETGESAIEMAGTQSLPAPTARNELQIAMRTFHFRNARRFTIQEFPALSQDLPEQSPSSRHDSLVVPVAKRRQFSTAYKRRIVREAAAGDAPGGIGALLRREGLYSSHLCTWRRKLESAEHARTFCQAFFT